MCGTEDARRAALPEDLRAVEVAKSAKDEAERRLANAKLREAEEVDRRAYGFYVHVFCTRLWTVQQHRRVNVQQILTNYIITKLGIILIK